MGNPNHEAKWNKLAEKRRARNYFLIFLPIITLIGIGIYVIVDAIINL